ncbi:hypothetical protein DEU56DRAFT_905644 [Suillus clintonianus]|uniref:uncharacterized protein n=1 Tax=Suillus clintonianus TaxID=1904413 RepID=UPI001B85C3F5|nr:uncharacterized protein DEU56DRAFT_905644 [Suillus clintonianus]KAG2107813.1 hypothetical protein DEU56DRAFT_905644 [Suillus clintonianus]
MTRLYLKIELDDGVESTFELAMGAAFGLIIASYIWADELAVCGHSHDPYRLSPSFMRLSSIPASGVLGVKGRRDYWRVSDFEQDSSFISQPPEPRTNSHHYHAPDIVQVVISPLGIGPFFLAHIIQFINLIRNILHVAIPLARVLAFLPPLAALFFPCVIHLSAQSSIELDDGEVKVQRRRLVLVDTCLADSFPLQNSNKRSHRKFLSTSPSSSFEAYAGSYAATNNSGVLLILGLSVFFYRPRRRFKHVHFLDAINLPRRQALARATLLTLIC